MSSNVLPTLLLGSRGENVRKLQGYLRILGQSLAVDGVFGPETRQAVITFQAQAGVRPMDGIVGPDTWAAIEQNLGISVDIEPTPRPIPEIEDPGAPGGLSPSKLIGGFLVGAAVLGVLFGRRKKK